MACRRAEGSHLLRADSSVRRTSSHCRRILQSAGSDSSRRSIGIRYQVQLNLPTRWNTKSMMYGGGGYDGAIPAVTGNSFPGPVDKAGTARTGLLQPSGAIPGIKRMRPGSRDASFGLNDEAINNFNGDALEQNPRRRDVSDRQDDTGGRPPAAISSVTPPAVAKRCWRYNAGRTTSTARSRFTLPGTRRPSISIWQVVSCVLRSRGLSERSEKETIVRRNDCRV